MPRRSSPGTCPRRSSITAPPCATPTRPWSGKAWPDELAEEVAPFLTGELLTAEEAKLLKAADRLSALVKCLEEQRSGNHEFDAALAQQKAALEAMHCPEADWFMAHCLPCYTQNLDELTRQDG